MLVRKGVRIDEDRLTHAVVGLMRYLPPSLWFSPFIQELRRRNPAVLRTLDVSQNPDVQLWPSYIIPADWRDAFWRPRSRKEIPDIPKQSICPDAVISTDNWIMFIESEYSHDLDTEQMFQQFAIASDDQKDKEFFLLLINRAISRPSHCGVSSASKEKTEAGVCPEDSLEQYIAASCSCSLEIPFTEHAVKKHLLWTNWQSLYQLLADLSLDESKEVNALPESFRLMVKRMRDDVCELLDQEGLVPIGFNIVPYLASLSMAPGCLPFLPSITPVIQLLSEFRIDLEAIPRPLWPDILKNLDIPKLWTECIPDPF